MNALYGVYKEFRHGGKRKLAWVCVGLTEDQSLPGDAEEQMEIVPNCGYDCQQKYAFAAIQAKLAQEGKTDLLQRIEAAMEQTIKMHRRVKSRSSKSKPSAQQLANTIAGIKP